MEVHVHAFMRRDGVIDAPPWTFAYRFTPETEANAEVAIYSKGGSRDA